MDAQEWDRRYRAHDLVWSADPNRFLAAEVGDLPPGRALDVAAGEGRNALWLAERGWQVTAIDFSHVAVDKGRAAAAERGVTVDWIVADVTRHDLGHRAYELVIVAYLQVPADQRRDVIARAGDAVADAGLLLVVSHDRSNLEHGYGGPPVPEVLSTPEEIAADLGGTGLTIVRADVVERDVETEDGVRHALDNLVLARRQR